MGLFLTILLISSILVLYFSGILFKDLKYVYHLSNSIVLSGPSFSSKPENYRGIAINSCIRKLFNSILNKRLDKYLEKHNIINP
jgi:hypothetical protein